MHAVAADGAQQLQDAARLASCTDPRSGQRLPLLRMRDPGCQASALSSASPPGGGRPPGLPTLLAMAGTALLLGSSGSALGAALSTVAAR